MKMKKIYNLILILSVLVISSTVVSAKKAVKTLDSDSQAAQAQGVKIAKKSDAPVQIIKPEKEKINKRQEIKKLKMSTRTKIDSSKEAEGMYESKFPVIDSKINP